MIFAEIYIRVSKFSLYKKANQKEKKNNKKNFYWIQLKKLNFSSNKDNKWKNNKIIVK